MIMHKPLNGDVTSLKDSIKKKIQKEKKKQNNGSSLICPILINGDRWEGLFDPVIKCKMKLLKYEDFWFENRIREGFRI